MKSAQHRLYNLRSG